MTNIDLPDDLIARLDAVVQKLTWGQSYTMTRERALDVALSMVEMYHDSQKHRLTHFEQEAEWEMEDGVFDFS